MIKLWINNVELDLSDDIQFPLTFQQADAKNPQKRKRNASKTIVLPGTKTNNKHFSSAYDLNISDVYGDLIGFDFDPTLRYPCLVTRNGKPIFRGMSNLSKVVTKKDVTNGRINLFTVILYSELANIFQGLGDLKVSELGWSDYDELLSIANIQASWTAPVGSGIWWPLIDYGFTNDPLVYLTNQLRPHIYIKEIIEKCFAYTGNTLSSAFFDSNLIKKIAWGYGGGEPILLTAPEITARRVNYTGDGTASYLFTPSDFEPFVNITKFDYVRNILVSDGSVVTMTQVVDPLSQFNELTGEIVAAHKGRYNLSIVGTFPLTYSLVPLIAFDDPKFRITVRARIFKNFAEILVEEVVVIDTANGSDTINFNISQDLELDTGDVVSMVFQISTFGTSNNQVGLLQTFNVELDLDNTLVFDLTATNSGLLDGDTVEVSRFLPEMKAVDFLNDMINMFNLYMSDPDPDGVIIAEPQDDYFFDTNDTDVWTDKLERSQDVEIESAANIEGKIYKFKFAEDRDYYKKLYFDIYGQDYGDFDYNVPSTFKKGDKLYQLKTAQSVPVEIEGTDIIIPRIIKMDDSTLVTSPHKGKPRMYFNNGLQGTDTWSLVNSDTLAVTAYTTYPQAHHLDSLSSATFDLNFGRPEVVFYTATTYTTDNLFYRYHAQFIRELTGRDSKIVNAWFRLRETDFYENFMRRLCNIDGVLYRKNVVKDWIANTNSLVKCELIKIVNGNSRANFTYTAVPQGFEPNMANGGEPDTPLVLDTTAKSYRNFYPFDTSGKSLVVTLDADTLKRGWHGEFSKIAAANNLTLSVTGGGAGGTSIDGMPTAVITGLNDSLTIFFDGQIFKII